MQTPQEEHMEAARCVLRYLKGTAGFGIPLKASSEMKLSGFCDSDWGVCPLSRRSLTGYFVQLSESPISWKTKKQAIVSRSSTEAEHRSMVVATSELVRLRSLLASLGVFLHQPMQLFCDSQAALHIAKNPVFHERMKHIELDCHFVREKVVAGILTLSHVETKDQPVYIFTKALGKRKFQYLQSKLGLTSLSAPT